MTPEGWRNMRLDEVAKVTSGGTPDRSKPHFWNGNIPWVTTAEIGNGPIKSTSECITEIGLQSSSAKIFPAGTLLMAMYGQGKTRGQISQLSIDAATNQACAAIIPQSTVCGDFLFHNLCSRYDEIRSLSNDGSQKNLSGSLIKEISLLLPPLREQQRIAEILSTWDHAIETVEALVANARGQKQALLQSLLTGEKRLAVFTSDWTKTTVDQIANVLVSNVDKKSVDAEESVRLCNYMDVYRSDHITADMDFMVATATVDQIRKFGLRVGDVLITKDSETPEDIAVPAYVASTAQDLVCGYHLAIIRPQKGCDGQFLKYYFEHPHTRYFFATRANGATRFGLTIDAIATAPITLPGYEEQQRIAAVIAAAEQEIDRLKPIAAALREEKSALMQQLLTGKRRVKLNEKEHA